MNRCKDHTYAHLKKWVRVHVFFAAWAYEIIHGREKMMTVQRIAKDECEKQKRARSEETKYSKRQKTTEECFHNELCSEEKDCIRTKVKSLAIEVRAFLLLIHIQIKIRTTHFVYKEFTKTHQPHTEYKE
jgi:hypothetical protein